MHWITMAYFERIWPPASRSVRRARLAALQLGRAHAKAYTTIHSARPDAKVGISLHTRVFRPANPHSPWDTGTARREQARCNRLFVEALATGRWPLSLRSEKQIRGTFDFVGISYFGRETVRFSLTRPNRLFAQRTNAQGLPVTDLEHETWPRALHELIIELSARNTPIIVLGNGIATENDALRCRYILDHLAAVRTAVDAGADVRGYFHRALLDGFEWTDGYSKRYGLFHVDRDSKSRTPNPSAFLYKEICQTGSVRPGTIAQFCPGWEENIQPVES